MGPDFAPSNPRLFAVAVCPAPIFAFSTCEQRGLVSVSTALEVLLSLNKNLLKKNSSLKQPGQARISPRRTALRQTSEAPRKALDALHALQ